MQIMSSLSERENLAGKVQMIYMDPPYGISYGGNFQVNINDRELGISDKNISREIEQIKAYRDTWSLGVHSYLSYLRDRFILARELLKESGSVFIQIGDENLPSVSLLLDEVFDRKNRVQIITFSKKSSTKKGYSVADYILWYAKNRQQTKMPDLFVGRGKPEDSQFYSQVELKTGERKKISQHQDNPNEPGVRFLYDNYPVVSQLASKHRTKHIEVQGKLVHCGVNQSWRHDPDVGLKRLERVGRLRATRNSARATVYWDDGLAGTISNVWNDVHGASNPIYVVQTNDKVIERCMLMSTSPGDIVLDPTCGSGTTAFVAEKWGRRWITTDTSRVAIAVARQRLLTSNFDYFELANPDDGVASGLRYKTIAKVTLNSIANNQNLDPILDEYDAILDEKLAKCNRALDEISDDLRTLLKNKHTQKQKNKGRSSITEGDIRRWILPGEGEKFAHWTIPFDADPDWPEAMKKSIIDYRLVWQTKMEKVNSCINANSEQTELVDQPIKVAGITRVSGPFSVESVQPPEMKKAKDSENHEMEEVDQSKNADAYLSEMINLLKIDGVRFHNNKTMKFTSLEPLNGRTDAIHAEGTWKLDSEESANEATVAVAIGPQTGTVTAMHIERLIKPVARNYDHLVVAGFNFDATAKTIFDEDQHPSLRIHMAHIRPDINPGMKGLLKPQKGTQLFTVFGQPRVKLEGPEKDDAYKVELEGVDIYDPVENTVKSSSAKEIAAWFVDTDYDGRTFCITQAFFPDKSAWKKLSKALNKVVDESVFEKFSGSVSLPFNAGDHNRVAVKVIDRRGNEVMKVLTLEGSH